MTLTFCQELAAADWIVHSDLPWGRLVGFGPAGFDSYARLRHLPDPVRPGQSENDVDPDGRPDQLATLVEVLAAQTPTPENCYFCVWDGFDATTAHTGTGTGTGPRSWYVDPERAGAWLPQPDARPGYAPLPQASSSTPQPGKVVVPHRAYWLFRGPLTDVGSWDTARDWPAERRLGAAGPAFIWPSDHAWCVAHDVDPHWAGIGGTTSLVTSLMTDPRLDLVPADPAEDQPSYS